MSSQWVDIQVVSRKWKRVAYCGGKQSVWYRIFLKVNSLSVKKFSDFMEPKIQHHVYKRQPLDPIDSLDSSPQTDNLFLQNPF
jgi:hypothetical protein